MNLYLRHIESLWEAQDVLRELGVDSAGVGIMAKKMMVKSFFLQGLSVRAANILKQECISVGGDLALPKAASFLEGEFTDAVLMMNEAQLERLLMKLKAQPFGLREVGERLQDVMRKIGNQRSSSLARPKIMGILNVTPDSFSTSFDGGALFVGGKIDPKLVMKKVEAMIDEGADYIDIGGESTGPGSVDVSPKEELARVKPVLDLLKKNKIYKKVKVSVDTYHSTVASAALESGMTMINDVTALRGDPKMASVLAKSKCEIVMMYSKDATARTTREKLSYDDVVKTVISFLEERINFAVAKGISRDRLVLDPGMGAFVSGEPKYSFEILRRLKELQIFGLPILVGTSRKSFLGGKLDERGESTLASSCVAYINGASFLRVHDVGAARRGLDAIWSTFAVRS